MAQAPTNAVIGIVEALLAVSKERKNGKSNGSYYIVEKNIGATIGILGSLALCSRAPGRDRVL